jgi:DNA segregation ATPase FtsK/SpoIIIE, S-DNA-T family
MAKGQAIRRSSVMPEAWVAAIRAGVRVGAGAMLALFGLALIAALASYNPADPSLNHATAREPTNFLGGFGATFADLLLQSFGLGAALLPPLVVASGVRVARGQGLDSWRRYVAATFAAAIVAAT